MPGSPGEEDATAAKAKRGRSRTREMGLQRRVWEGPTSTNIEGEPSQKYGPDLIYKRVLGGVNQLAAPETGQYTFQDGVVAVVGVA